MSGIRVIAGTARGRRLQPVPGDSTRPITDRVKENLFNIIGVHIVRSSFLDLFAGTGGVGIEALSRGAAYGRFLDLDRRAVRVIQQNLQTTGLGENAEVLQRDALSVLQSEPDRPYDFIFIAPPQYRGMSAESLRLLDARPGWLAEDGWAIAQIDPKEDQDLALENLEIFDQRKYGNTKLLFFRLKD
ncbi:MAG TPA: 16S rRNA (guanine(966)-N(2))-methyltransferase RsmD [Anaerolineales bacterium]|nr:16S rRNA (guanine(966)-N(2))-methyltransferase RsmD [Anaerolineales bacterium]